LGVGLTAYVLGLRHAFDADHIAAIDNTTRRLAEEGRRPLSVGFWFSLGLTAGMALLDTLDGSFMSMAYGWTLAEPVRKVYVNLTMTGLSVAALLAATWLAAVLIWRYGRIE
jgi:high-affinity nickel permease